MTHIFFIFISQEQNCFAQHKLKQMLFRIRVNCFHWSNKFGFPRSYQKSRYSITFIRDVFSSSFLFYFVHYFYLRLHFKVLNKNEWVSTFVVRMFPLLIWFWRLRYYIDHEGIWIWEDMLSLVRLHGYRVWVRRARFCFYLRHFLGTTLDTVNFRPFCKFFTINYANPK